MRFSYPVPPNLNLSIRVIKTLTLLILLGSIAVTSYELGYLSGEDTTRALYSEVWASGADSAILVIKLRMIITACVAISLLGVWTKRFIGVLICLLGFIAVVAVYFWWHEISADILKGARLTYFPSDITHIGPFIYAVWWDIVVLVMIICLLMWLTKILAVILKENR